MAQAVTRQRKRHQICNHYTSLRWRNCRRQDFTQSCVANVNQHVSHQMAQPSNDVILCDDTLQSELPSIAADSVEAVMSLSSRNLTHTFVQQWLKSIMPRFPCTLVHWTHLSWVLLQYCTDGQSEAVYEMEQPILIFPWVYQWIGCHCIRLLVVKSCIYKTKYTANTQ